MIIIPNKKMSELDLGEYKSDYSNIFPLKKNYDQKLYQDDSPIRIYDALKNNQGVFLKVININALKEEDDFNFQMKRIEKEIEISYKCNSDFTVKLIRHFKTNNNIIMEKEHCDSDLKDILFQNGAFKHKMVGKNNLQTFKDIILDLANALKFINEKGVVHRDIKPHNIYVKKDNNSRLITKLANFGSAIYIKDIKNAEPMGTVFYTAPEIINNFDYNEKCDMWSLGMTLFEIYFGVLPYGWYPNTKKMNDMLLDEKGFIFEKSNIPTLDILFKRLLQINPDKRMSISEFYEYVNDKNFLNGNSITTKNTEIYLQIYEGIKKEKKIDYGDGRIPEKLNQEEADQQNMEKILDLVGEGNLPDLMNFPNGSVKENDRFNNIIYYDSNIEKHKTAIHKDSDKIERRTPGAFILCTNLKSLEVIKNEILRHRRNEKKTMFNLISNGRGYQSDIKNFLEGNPDFKKSIQKLCIYCQIVNNYIKYKDEDPEFIDVVTNDIKQVYEFVDKYSSEDIKAFPLTKLVTLNDYLDKYKERHKKISDFYGNLSKEDYLKNMDKIKEIIDKDEKDKLLKAKKKDNLLKGLMTFNIEKDLENLDELIVKEYTKNTFYGDLNRWLMKGKMKYYEPVAYFTSRLMYHLNNMAGKYDIYCKENKKILHRGAKLYYSCLLPYERAVGKIILLSGFTSTSEKKNIAENWAGRGKEEEVYRNSSKFSVIFHITNLFNEEKKWISNSVDIHKHSKYIKEKEFLFQPFSFYRVNKVSFDIDNYKADIELETVGKKEILEEKIKMGKEVKYNNKENIMEIF